MANELVTAKDLLPCPFCNGKAYLADLGDETSAVACENCNAQGGYYGGSDSTSPLEAAKMWNRRNATVAELATLRAENARMKEALGSAKMHRVVWLHDAECFSMHGEKPCVCGREALMKEIDAALAQPQAIIAARAKEQP